MRDRLKELLKNAKYPLFEGYPAEVKLGVQHSDIAFDAICDYLLANGVIVPPCKVGDAVYFDTVGYHDSAEIDGIHIDAQGTSFTWVQYDIGVDITELWDEGDFDIEEIGKSVFLTREEAEAKLKGEQ